MAATTVVVEEDSGMESLSSCNEQPVQMENFVTLFIVVLNRKGEFDEDGEEEVLQQLRLFFDASQTVWRCKQRILANLLEHTVRDPLNYGLYCPAANGKAGKFLDEERLIREYGLSSPAMLEFKYKRRVYKMMSINQRKLRQLHSKSTLRQFIDYVRHNNVERVNRLLVSGLDPNFCDPESGETPLSLSVSLPKPYDMICALFNGGAHVDFRGAGGLTPVHKAARCAAPVSLRTLLELGAAANYRDQRGLTPLYHAVSQPRADLNCIDMLLRDRAQLNVRDEQQCTEVHQAARGGHSSIVEHLLYYGSVADAQNAIGNTALHLAAIEGHEAVVRVLLFRGAQKDVRNSAQNTPYEVAVLAGHLEIAKVIANHNPAEVVPYRDSPVYTQRRHLATPARMPLSRSSSDNRLAVNFSVVNANGGSISMANAGQGKRSFFPTNADMNSINLCNSTGDYASSSSPSTNGGIYYATRLQPTGELAISGGSMSAFSANLDMANFNASNDFAANNQSVLGPGEEGMFEGQDAESGRRGYFPSRCVREVGSLGSSGGANFLEASLATTCDSFTLQKPSSLSAAMSLRHRSRSAATLYADELLSVPRTVVIQRTPAGFGFVLKGPRASQPGQIEIDFAPTPSMPATQYLAVVETGSVADRAGLKPKDYVLEIDGVSVASATHERCVDLIRASSDMLQLKVVTINSSGQIGMGSNSVCGAVDDSVSVDTAHGRPPRPWQGNMGHSGGASQQCSSNYRQSQPPQPPQLSTANGIMTLSRHPQLRHLAPVEQLELSLRSQLTLPRQPKLTGAATVLRNVNTANSPETSFPLPPSSLMSRRTALVATNDQQQQQHSGDGESDYETIDDSGCIAPVPPPPASASLLVTAVTSGKTKPTAGSVAAGRMATPSVTVNITDVDEAVTYSSQLEQMDSGNSSCSNTNNEEITSAGTLYANAGQLRRLYGVGGDESLPTDDQSHDLQRMNGFCNDDANYDTLADDQRQVISKPAHQQQQQQQQQQLQQQQQQQLMQQSRNYVSNTDNNEDIYENDTNTVDDGTCANSKDGQMRLYQQQRGGECRGVMSTSPASGGNGNVAKGSVSFSARAEETRRAFLDQLQRPVINMNNQAHRQAAVVSSKPQSTSSTPASQHGANNSSFNAALGRRQEAVFIAEF